MAINYYLMNGKNGIGKALNVPVDGELHRDFIDISSLDLVTMDIKKEEARDFLQEYNPRVKLDGSFYDASFPHKKAETRTYSPIFDMCSENTQKYLNSLREFAERRDYQIRHGKQKKLEVDRKLDKFIKELSMIILKNYNGKLLGYESLIASNLKDIYRERFTFDKNKGTEQYMLSKLQLLRSYLSNYTQLRNLVIEYISLVEENKIVQRTDINRYSHWDNYGMEVKTPIIIKPEEPIKEEPVYKQLSLDMFMDMNPKKKN